MLSQGLFRFSCCPASQEAGGAWEFGRGQRQDNWSKVAQGIFLIPYHMVSCWIIKLGRIGCWFPAHCSGTSWATVSRGGATVLFISWFIWSLTVIFSSFPALLNCLYPNLHILLFLSQLSPPSHWGGSKRTPVWCSPVCWVKPKQFGRGAQS